MTDPDSALPPEQDDEVRRLLADSRHTAPMPPEVAARLERVLADLGGQAEPPPTVTRLASRRRRVTGLLVAAAAVVAVGAGVNQVVQVGGSGGGDSMSAAEDASGGDALAAESESARDRDLPLRVRRQHFERDARLAQRFLLADRDAASLGDGAALRAGCRDEEWGAGTLVPARYGSAAAVIVLRRPTGDTQVADLFVCGRVEPVRTVRLPAP